MNYRRKQTKTLLTIAKRFKHKCEVAFGSYDLNAEEISAPTKPPSDTFAWQKGNGAEIKCGRRAGGCYAVKSKQSNWA